jgi:predicted transcriptional regulator
LVNFEHLLEIVGSGTRLHLLELLGVRARSLKELASSLHVTQQAVMKHLAMLERNGLIQEISAGGSRVRKVYALSGPLSLGYVFKDNTLCVYMGTDGHDAKSSKGTGELLKQAEYERNMIRMRAKVLANRLRTLVLEDLKKQAEIHSAIKGMKASPIEAVALSCFSALDSERVLEEASKAFGLNLREVAERALESEA